MFGIGLPELILIMAVALIVVGPEKLPELAKSLAKGIVELKKAAGALKDSLQEDEKSEDWKPLSPPADSDKPSDKPDDHSSPLQEVSVKRDTGTPTAPEASAPSPAETDQAARSADEQKNGP